MRILPPITALAVATALYLAVFERDRLFAPEAADDAAVSSPEDAPLPENPPISVVAMDSVAVAVPNALVARGRTEAARQVTARRPGMERGRVTGSDPP